MILYLHDILQYFFLKDTNVLLRFRVPKEVLENILEDDH